MIIPTLGKHIRKFKIGDTVILTEDYYFTTFMLTTGHELEIIGKDGYGFILEEKELGIIIKKCSIMKFTHKVTLEESKKSYKNWKDKNKFIKFIKDNCPEKDYTYEDREKVDTCRWREKERRKDNYGWKYCKPDYDCFHYIPEDKFKNNSFILNYNRKVKLKKLKNHVRKGT